MDRRKFLLTQAYLFSLLSTPLVASCNNFSEKKRVNQNESSSFELYNQLHFKNMPNPYRHGLKKITVIYADQMWADRVKRNVLDENFLLKKYKGNTKQGDNSIICLDIEHWPYRRVSAKKFNESLNLYIETLDLFREIFPNSKIGFFEFSPTSYYPLYDQFAGMGVVNKKLLYNWEKEQDRLKPLTDKVDLFFPQLYSRWPNNPDGWESCARIVLEKSREIANGKPVIPFVWPQYWNDSEAIIAGEYWKRILEVLYQFSDSAVFWSIYKTAPEWDGDFEWWLETKRFLRRG